MMIQGSGFSFNAFDSSAVTVNFNPGNSSGLSPLFISACVSSSNKFMFSLNTSVDDIARGLSTYTGAFIKVSYSFKNFSSFLVSFILFSSYKISCVLPTANDGITTVPLLSNVSETISKNISAFLSFFICFLLPYVDSITK